MVSVVSHAGNYSSECKKPSLAKKAFAQDCCGITNLIYLIPLAGNRMQDGTDNRYDKAK